MDPISVSSSIIGILAAAAAITSSVTGFVRSVKVTPKSVQHVLSEVADIRICLVQLQPFLLGMSTAPISRTSLLMVQQILVSLTECVTTFSELEETLNPLIKGQQSTVDKMKWAWKEQAISRLLERLRSSKTSLGLMLITLNSAGIEEARQSSKKLHHLVQQVLKKNHEISRRLRDIEINSRRDSITSGLIENDAMTTRSEIQEASKYQMITETKTFTSTFESALQNSRVYTRNALRHLKSSSSLPSETAPSLTWSFLSGLSLTDVTNVSVLSLPLSVKDLWNFNYYVEYGFSSASRESGTRVPHSLRYEHSESNQHVAKVQLVLLGVQFSGKTTVLNQLRLLYGKSGAGDKYVKRERMDYHQDIFMFINESLREFSEEAERWWVRDQLTKDGSKFPAALLIDEISLPPVSNDELVRIRNIAPQLKHFWTEIAQDIIIGFKEWKMKEIFCYYMKNIVRLIEPDYIPTDQDILHWWVRTTGIYKTDFLIREVEYCVTDVAGAKAERWKWIYRLSSHTDCIIYTVDLSGYHCKDEHEIEESYLVLKNLLKVPELAQTYVALFFTKMDIFSELILHRPISDNFPDYTGGSSLEKACEYFASRFRASLNNSSRELDIFYVNATDSTSFEASFRQVHEKIIKIQSQRPLPSARVLKSSEGMRKQTLSRRRPPSPYR